VGVTRPGRLRLYRDTGLARWRRTPPVGPPTAPHLLTTADWTSRSTTSDTAATARLTLRGSVQPGWWGWGLSPGGYSPVSSSTDSRRRSAWPLCRAYSSIRWTRIHRRLGASPSGQVHRASRSRPPSASASATRQRERPPCPARAYGAARRAPGRARRSYRPSRRGWRGTARSRMVGAAGRAAVAAPVRCCGRQRGAGSGSRRPPACNCACMICGTPASLYFSISGYRRTSSGRSPDTARWRSP
jgi:hypothetical protein